MIFFSTILVFLLPAFRQRESSMFMGINVGSSRFFRLTSGFPPLIPGKPEPCRQNGLLPAFLCKNANVFDVFKLAGKPEVENP